MSDVRCKSSDGGQDTSVLEFPLGLSKGGTIFGIRFSILQYSIRYHRNMF